ncbi:phytoene/squalene synthase family protein [Corynebacterium liangguodongii]|uniref:phytoene/squalene synthase family protein n=1 Tax=Corynebacterium liangguodongii TaxID=2079535 RepID=UPI001F422BF0|nr:phytoene/squalene synthase family protein [Corynebacterium liangguodongii]
MNAALSHYDRACDRVAAQVIAEYSTSFSLATRLLGPAVRRDVRNLYAMARIADEIVDGAGGSEKAALLDTYEASVRRASATRFHTDPVLHAFANSARRCRFDDSHLEAFFASMRRDLTQRSYAPAEFESYVYGSAEVIGLMCVNAFLADAPVDADVRRELDSGARALGSAFQKVNFLRDLGEDHNELGRTYFPRLIGRELDDHAKAGLVAEIRSELARAERAIALLPRSCRAGVAAAHAIFTELTNLIDATPAAALASARISVSNHRKLYLAARALGRHRG